MATDRRYLNADHDPADFSACPCGHTTRQFDLPAGKITGRVEDWILAYVCDACADDIIDDDDDDSANAPIIQVPHLDRLSELRMINNPPLTLAH